LRWGVFPILFEELYRLFLQALLLPCLGFLGCFSINAIASLVDKVSACNVIKVFDQCTDKLRPSFFNHFKGVFSNIQNVHKERKVF
jgi:hypothetical protein